MQKYKHTIGYIGNSFESMNLEFSDFFEIKKIDLSAGKKLKLSALLIEEENYQSNNLFLQKWVDRTAHIFFKSPTLPYDDSKLYLHAESTLNEKINLVFYYIDIFEKNKKYSIYERNRNSPYNIRVNKTVDLIKEIISKSSKSLDLQHICRALQVAKPDLLFDDVHILIENEDNSISIFSKDTVKNININHNIKTLFAISNTKPQKVIDNKIINYLKVELNQPIQDAALISSSKKNFLVIFSKNQIFQFTEDDLQLIKIIFYTIQINIEKVLAQQTREKKIFEWANTFNSISEPISVIDENYNLQLCNSAFYEKNSLYLNDSFTKCYEIFANEQNSCKNCPKESISTSTIKINKSKSYMVSSYKISNKPLNLFIQFYRSLNKELQLTSAFLQSEKMVALGMLVKALSHELSNPIAGIISITQILLRDPEAADNKEELEEILDAAFRSKKIIENLLNFTGESIVEKTSLLGVVASSIDLAKAILKKIKVIININDNIQLFNFNISALQQILFNLITNAAAAMPDGGVLTISAKNENEKIFIHLNDTGIGINSDKLKMIFEPFFTNKQDGSGTGLGLLIVKNLLQKINGEITVDSKEGVGTDFQIVLNHGAV